MERGGRGPVKAVFKIDSGDDSGREIKAIYQLTGTILKIAFSQNDDYPSNFRSTDINNVVSLVYKNDKPPVKRKDRKLPGLPTPGLKLK